MQPSGTTAGARSRLAPGPGVAVILSWPGALGVHDSPDLDSGCGAEGDLRTPFSSGPAGCVTGLAILLPGPIVTRGRAHRRGAARAAPPG